MAAAPLVAACFYDFTYDSGGADGGSGGHDASVDSSVADAPSDGDPGDASSEDVNPLPDTFVPPTCKPGCGVGFYCRYDDHLCGRGVPGKCVPVPVTGCSTDTAYYCGCGNVVMKSDCELFGKGADFDVGGCTGVDSQHFQCGWEYCSRTASFCQQYKTKGTFACVDWVAVGCDAAAHDCTCAKTSCNTQLCDAGDGGLTLTCNP